MRIIINILILLAQIAEKAITWRPFWNSQIPYNVWKYMFLSAMKMQNLRVYREVRKHVKYTKRMHSFIAYSNKVNKKFEEMRIKA